MATKFTPGPWLFEKVGPVMRSYSQPFGIIGWLPQEDGKPKKAILVAGCFGDIPGGEAEATANARLIAKAPEMAELLKSISEHGYLENGRCRWCGLSREGTHNRICTVGEAERILKAIEGE